MRFFMGREMVSMLKFYQLLSFDLITIFHPLNIWSGFWDLMKVVDFCLSFPMIQKSPLFEFYRSSYGQITKTMSACILQLDLVNLACILTLCFLFSFWFYFLYFLKHDHLSSCTITMSNEQNEFWKSEESSVYVEWVKELRRLDSW